LIRTAGSRIADNRRHPRHDGTINMTKKILCTLGPASMSADIIQRLGELGVSLLRINLSHVSAKDVERHLDFLMGVTDIPVCLDTEGAQVRTGNIVEGAVHLIEGSIIRAHRRTVPGDNKDFNFYPLDVIDDLEIGDFISIDFNAALVQVIAKEPDVLKMRVITSGIMGKNKAVTVERDIALDPLTEKDREALEIGMRKKVSNFALSFANRGSDVAEIRKIVGDSFVISKIECRNGLRNLSEIATASNAILIDRGDLSREIPIEKIPIAQKEIITRGHELKRPVYVATNLLESMVNLPQPTRAEVNDIYNTLADGADGLVLAAETAIGSYPIRCTSMISRIIQQFEAKESVLATPTMQPSSMLTAPHGGRLMVNEATVAEDTLASLPALTVSENILMDCEQLTHGTYSPLDGFMDKETVLSVLAEYALPSGTAWTLPITLQVPAADAGSLAAGTQIALKGADGIVYAVLDVSETYALDLERVLPDWFGTASDEHPGVRNILNGGSVFVAGKVAMVRPLPSPYRHFQLTPRQCRFVFNQKGWTKVVGFHGRNPPHRAHEYIQLQALERANADGLFISPVIGPKKSGDFTAGAILQAYQTMLEFQRYPKDAVVLGSFATYSRYAGPREAVFTALCRKNMGCSHFIIGRDHTGVGDFYAKDGNAKLFERLGDIGIEPLFFDNVGFDPATGAHREMKSGETLQSISGTEVRNRLRAGKMVPDWFMTDVVQDALLNEQANGRPLFVE
jgi:pyruvate kinase